MKRARKDAPVAAGGPRDCPSSSAGPSTSLSLDSDSDIESGRILRQLESTGSQRCTSALSTCFLGMDAEHHICVLLAPQDHKKFHVLKGVVEEWSPVLTAALLHHGSSSTDDCKTVILENFALEVIECFVRFLYHGRLDDSPAPELLWELALMGRYYDVPNLQDQCFAWLEYYACADHNNSQWLVPSLHDLPSHGFELHEVCKCCKGSHLLRRFRLTLSDFLDLRFNDTAAFDLEPAHVAKLVLSHGVSLLQVTSDRISIATLLERGWRPEDVLLCGFTIDEIRSAGIRVTPPSTAVLSQKNISVGMKVRTVSHVNKSELDNKLARVTTANRASLWVKFLEGPKESHNLKRTYSQIKLCEPVVAVAPAGMENDVETGEPEAKKKACEAAARMIFQNCQSSGSAAVSS